jgi:chromosome segregation ATPase
MLRKILLLFLPLALAASAAHAQSVYRWVDDEGETHYGQTVPPEFKDYGYVRLGPDGTVRERVEPALSPEEIAERRRQRAEQARQEAAERSQEARDRMLLATYSSEEDLREALDMQLAGIESQRASTRMALDLVENRFESLVGRAAELNRQGRGVPDRLQTDIEETRAELRGLRGDLERLEEREQEARDRFAANLERYRDLTAPREEDG